MTLEHLNYFLEIVHLRLHITSCTKIIFRKKQSERSYITSGKPFRHQTSASHQQRCYFNAARTIGI